MNRQHWIWFRFQDNNRDLQCLAERGFQFYGLSAQSLLPELVKLSRSHDPELRMVAYEAAFFTRPDKEIFLPLASRALKENDQGVRAVAAQWLEEHFSDEAAQTMGLTNQTVPASVTNTVTATSILKDISYKPVAACLLAFISKEDDRPWFVDDALLLLQLPKGQ